MRQRAISTALVATLLLTACGGDDDTTADTTPGDTAGTVADTVDSVAPSEGGSIPDLVGGEAVPTARCEANRAAGTITYLSSFDFAATASIVEILVADERGYFDELCLDVEIKASFSTANYPLIAADDAQFSSGGSFSEVVNFAAANEADLVAVAIEGRTAIDALIVKPGTATELADLAGTMIGVKGKITPSVAAMLAQAGLVEGEDYETVLLDGFDPLAHIAIPDIVGFPGYKSNEPGQLERAGIDFDLFDPSANGIPGSFGILYTNRTFLSEHPTAAQDFVRAAMKGLADAIADPQAAAEIAIARINGNGNPNFLSPEGEAFRWQTESQLVVDNTPAGTPIGVPDPVLLQNEVDTYAAIGLFGEGGAPPIDERYVVDLIAGVYDDSGRVIWPSA
jgi:NitT/TauT family transport system substrate-binding protein